MSKRRINAWSLVAVLLLSVLALSACGDSSDDAQTTAAGGAAGDTTASAAPADAAPGIDAVGVALGQKYTGGKPGKADAGLSPVLVGFTSNNGGTPAFPEMAAAAKAAVGFVNDKLSGVGGHPVKLVQCDMQTEEDGQKCGAQFLNDKVSVVVVGLAVVGNASLYKTINGKVPVLIGATAAPADYTADNAFNLGGGGSAVLWGVASAIARYKPEHVALVSNNSGTGGVFTTEKLAIPYLKRLGLDFGKPAYYPPTVTAPEMGATVQAAGASKADVILFNPSAPLECTLFYNALKQFSIAVPVVTTQVCNAESFVKETGDGPEGWTLSSFGTNPRVDDPEANLYNAIMTAYGQGAFRLQGLAPQSMRDLLAIAKFGNTLGPDKLTTEALIDQIKATRTAFMTPGTLHCGKPYDPAQPVPCGDTATGATFKDGTWTAVAPVQLPPLQ